METVRKEHAPAIPRTRATESMASEKLYFRGDLYFADLIKQLRTAEFSIDLEVYILSTDEVGSLFYEILKDAVKRGVQVRLLVDGIGSFYWTQTHLSHFRAAGIEVKVFHPFPWSWPPSQWSFRGIWFGLQKLARRDHRKLFLIDKKVAFTGSLNITKNSLKWRESGMRLLNENAVPLMQAIFEDTWTWADNSHSRYRTSNFYDLQDQIMGQKQIRCNQFYRLARALKTDITNRIDAAQQRVWLETPYFVPPPSLFFALIRAAKRKVDVRIILPFRSDVLFVPWIANLYYQYLLSAGVKIFEYTPQILHAKMAMIDSWGMIGSSNLNHRSAFSDLELDVVIQSPEALEDLEQQFQQDMNVSTEILKVPFGGWRKIVAKFLFNWRSWF